MSTHNEAVELRRLRALFDNVPFGLAVSTPQGQVQQVNPAILRIFGFTATEEFMAAPAAEHYADPADRQRFVAILRERGAVADFEARFKRQDGALFPGLTSATRVSTEEGDVFLSTFQDITERKRAEETISRLARQNALILNSAGEGILGMDSEGRITFVNPAAAAMLGHRPEELIGQQGHANHHHTRPDGSSYPREECPIYAAFHDGIVRHVDNEVFWRKDGASFPVEYTCTPIRENGGVAGAVVMFGDISERKRVEEVITRQAREIMEMSMPVVQVWEAITLVPLIGMLDSQRTQQLVERLLQRIVETNSSVAMLDISGVPAIDTRTAQHLIETISAVRLLGAQVILTGVRPAIAQTLVHLGIDLSGVITRASLTDGLRLALEMAGLQVTKKSEA